MKALWLGALLLLISQEENKIHRLVRQLGDDNIVLREQATTRLIEIGEPAKRALLEAARREDLEVRARAHSILGEIELAKNRKKAFGAPMRLSIPEGEHTLGRMATSLKEQCGVSLDIPESLARDTVRMKAKNMLVWKFLDALSRRHGGLTLPLNQPKHGFSFKVGRPTRFPRYSSGQFLLLIERLKLERRDPVDFNFNQGGMLLTLLWQPNVRPLSNFYKAPKIELKAILGDDGESLLEEKKPGRRRETPYSGFQYGATYRRAHRQFIRFKHPAPGVRKLTRIEGAVTLALPLRTVTFSFKKPLETARAKREEGSYSVTLKKCERSKENLTATLHFSVPEARTEQSHNERKIELRARLDRDQVVMVDEEGKEHHGRRGYSGHSSGGGAETLDIEFHFPPDVTPAELRLPFLVDYFERRIEFEFRDVELP